MAIQIRGLLITFLIVAALFSYAVGSMSGLVFFVVLGGIFEMLFWFKLLGRKGRF